MRVAELVQTSLSVRSTRSRKKKIALLAALLRRVEAREIEAAVAALSGRPRQGKIGLGYVAAHEIEVEALGEASASTLELVELDDTLQAIAEEKGAGSSTRRQEAFGRLLAQLDADGQAFLRGLVVGELRQGALEGVMVEAIAEAGEVEAGLVRRALMLSGDLGVVAATALGSDATARLRAFALQVFRPVQPMLASPADHVEAALETLGGNMALEWKLDGARIQVHKDGDAVEVYTRKLNRVTKVVPEVVELVRALPARRLVLDGEVLALHADGRPQPFQTTMRRFGRKLDVEAMRTELPLSPFFFDVLLLDDQMLVDAGTQTRWEAMRDALPESLRTPRLITANVEEAQGFVDAALDQGHEGVMAKGLELPYEAGRRGAGWLKLKPSHTLDLVVLAAEWGSGRRQGWLSNLHLGARDPESNTYVMLGKTFKGLTDELLAWQTEAFQKAALGEEGHVVHLPPRFVVEIAFSDVQQSPHYPAGMALRFARVKGYRRDKSPEDADTIGQVRDIFERQHG